MPYGGPYGTYVSPSYSETPADVNVAIHDDYFQPSQVTVPAGTTVSWTNSGRHRHTVTSDTRLWDSDELAPGEDYAHKFTDPGTYHYHCSIHAQEMRGVVIVK
jgi:plastocyanin